jgi:PAP2 superfamily
MFATYRIGYHSLFALAAIDFSIAFSFGTSPASAYIPSLRFVYKTLPVWALLPLAWAGLLLVAMIRRRVDRPLSVMRRMLHRHWLGRGLIFILMIVLFARGITSFKSAIPKYVPFYADPWLADIDRLIFGTDPWLLTHALIGPYGTMVLDRLYASWFPIMMLYIGWFCFSRNQILQLRGLLTFLLCWGLLGNLCALLFSSVGPCFYENFYQDTQFAPLLDKLNATDSEHPLIALGAMNFLLDSIGKDRFGSGISAMPSLHVAIAFLCFLVAWEYGRHWWAKLIGFLFFVTIAVGSVHLGWHYAVDGIVSIVVTGLIWWGTGRFVRWLEAREAVQAGPAVPPLAATAPA